MDYVIYGAGYRGKRFFDYIKTENVFAFIDLDKAKQGKEYCGKPIISIDEYKEKYMSCFIIITPIQGNRNIGNNNIEDMLERYNIYQYSNLKDMPSEFAGYGECGFYNCYEELKNGYNEPFCIYGVNALSFLIYDFLIHDKEISIFPGENCKLEKLEWVKKYYPEIRLKEYTEIDNNEIMLVSESNSVSNFTGKTLNLFEYANSNKQYWNDKLLKFKDIYKAHKRCFIVATGPSLRIDDLHTLAVNNVFCFGVNNILKIEKEWIPDAYVVADSKIISDNIKNIDDYNCKYKFIGDSCQEYWSKERVDSYKIHVTTAGTMVDFSEEICQKLYSGYNGRGGTITYICLQLAVYMGFKDIYLLGVDCNYIMGSKNNHFIADETEDYIDHGLDSMIKSYEFAKQYADAHGIKIYNATRGGMLEVFERVDFDLLF